MITSDNDAYKAASRPGRDSLHLVSNEAYAVVQIPEVRTMNIHMWMRSV